MPLTETHNAKILKRLKTKEMHNLRFHPYLLRKLENTYLVFGLYLFRSPNTFLDALRI